MDPNQLAQLEGLCTSLYTSASGTERAQAQQSVLVLQSSAEYIPQCQYVLDNSNVAYALLVASNSLTHLITTHWNNFSSSQRVDIRNYILGYLANKGSVLEAFVTKSLIQLVCRITKLGWFDDPQHREITQEVTKFLQATVEHCILGLRMLKDLVAEMNQPTRGYSLTQHRRAAVSFRDLSLLRIFQLAMTSLKQLQVDAVACEMEQKRRLADAALDLTVTCLNFDFIGTNADESAEDVGTIQIPTAWRAMVQDASTMQLLFDIYTNAAPPQSSKTLEALMLLASVRRSLFSTDKDRSMFLEQLMGGVRNILKNQLGLNHPQNHHEFCRLLGRLKVNYQLSELIRTDGYKEWLSLAADFTLTTFQQYQWATNSIHYLLGLWQRLVSAVPYVKTDTDGLKSQLSSYVFRVIQSFVRSRLEAVQPLLSSGADEPLDDEGSLHDQLDRLPALCRYQYANVGHFLVLLIDPLMQQYRDLTQAPSVDPSVQERLLVVEYQLTWLTYIVAAVIGGHTWSNSHVSAGKTEDADEQMDASLCRRVLQLVQYTEFRATSTAGQVLSDVHLELAFLYFFQQFRKAYVGEHHGIPATAELLAHSVKHQMFARFFENVGLGDHVSVVNVMVTKVGNNLKYWVGEEEVISKTLALFFDIASGYTSSKLLLGLDTVHFLLANHTPEHFSFLSSCNSRFRTTFHSTLARLLFSSVDNHEVRFAAFMEPIGAMLTQLAAAPDYRNEGVKTAIIGVCRDLRGVATATHNRRTYGSLFDLLYPTHFPVLERAAETWFDAPEVTSPLLKLMMELVYNKAQRITFEQSSPNGILLFRQTSAILVSIGSRILRHPVGQDIYRERYKCIALCMTTLSRALSGGYVNFGVFALYEDKALDNALDVVLQLALSVPLADLLSYPKLSVAYYCFLEVLFRNHITVILSADSSLFLHLISSISDGINSLNATLSTTCCSTVDHLASYYFKNQAKDSEPMRQLRSHLSVRPDLFHTMLSTLFSLLLYGNTVNQWSVSRPILSLMLANEEALNAYKAQLLASQPPEHHPRLLECFATMLDGVHLNLEPSNRDKFTQKLSSLRNVVRQFITL